MGDGELLIPTLEGEEHVIAAAQHIVRALGTNKNLTDDVRKILVDLDSRLSTMTVLTENKKGGIKKIEERLIFVQEKIMSWELGQSMIWDSGPMEAAQYLQAVDEVRRLAESLGSLSLDKGREENELLCMAHNVLQIAMARLGEEFSHILVQNRQPFEPERMSFCSCEEDVVNPNVIPDLRCIANVMIASNYDQECFQAYISIRKDALEECLFILEVEKVSIEDVLKMDWSSLNCKIKKWIRNMKIFVRVYLAGEKQLCGQIFGEFGPVNSSCFDEISKASIMRLLNIGEAIAIGPRQPEKLFGILDMYEVLADLLPDIDALFSGEAGSFVRTECHEILRRLADSVRGTFVDFRNAVLSDITNPSTRGAIHPLTNYVMNYIKALTDYSDTLILLLEDRDGKDPMSSLPNMNPVIAEEIEGESSSYSVPLMGHYLQSVTLILESNLDGKSKFYKDISLQHFFLMNNIHYMVQKVKGSELRVLFGDDWIRKHNGRFQQLAMNYERATWSSILSLLKEERNCNPGSNFISKTVTKERLRSFNLAFEEVYKSQTGWLIRDLQLREDLRISTSLKVIQAYRTFMGRHANLISDKYIKYCTDDLENYLLDLFEGSPRSLHNPRRRYSYKLGHRLFNGTFVWSETYNFRASPYPGQDSLQRVVIFGDMGKAEADGSNEYNNYQPGSLNTTKQLIRDLRNIDIVFHIGDLSYANGYLSQWDQFTSQVEPIASTVPYMVASGNHERDWPGTGSFYGNIDSGGECGVLAETMFYVPAENRAKFWYSTDYGMFHFCIADTEHDWREGTEQYKFIEHCLASADRQKQPWLIFIAHRVLGYSSSSFYAEQGSFEEPMGRESLQRLLQKYKVDLAVYGHVHNYERTCPIYQNICTNEEKSYYQGSLNGTIHVVAGGGGAALAEFTTLQTKWSLFKDHDFGFLKLTAFDHSNMLFEYKKSSDGKVYDSFRISRDYRDILACTFDSCPSSTLAS
ncbi:hypothetical protein HHK36_015466 [Tetracentron sinense]|uniref:Exocyst subunit Exo70 family protein n=1 Tax=Tetracentron sinense TaxID=13715 RepID=A0A834Z558_TETSI|nr:hypothetical protein HHK36_015466 [Tetracentron sinense]